MKILLLKPSSLGDVIQALPVLRLLKKWRPDARVYWWLQTELLPLLEGDPDLAGLIPFDRRQWARPRHWGQLWTTLRDLRRQRFDWVIDLQCLARSGAVAWLANGRLLAGLDDHREGARGFYDIIVPRATWHTHAVEWYLAVLKHLAVPVNRPFVWLPPRPAERDEIMRRHPDTGDQWVVLAPGARWPTKRWPVEHFQQLVRLLAARRPGLRLVLLGGPDDQDTARAIAAAAPAACLDLAGRTSLPQMIEWIRRADAMVTNDTGPMHAAAALRKPTLALFGPTEPRRTGPYGQPANVLQVQLECVPCLRGDCRLAQPIECLRRLRPEMVAARLFELLDRPAAPEEWVINL